MSQRLRPVRWFAFIGPSGTGKSTLLAFMMRYYDPTSGPLRLDHGMGQFYSLIVCSRWSGRADMQK